MNIPPPGPPPPPPPTPGGNGNNVTGKKFEDLLNKEIEKHNNKSKDAGNIPDKENAILNEPHHMNRGFFPINNDLFTNENQIENPDKLSTNDDSSGIHNESNEEDSNDVEQVNTESSGVNLSEDAPTPDIDENTKIETEELCPICNERPGVLDRVYKGKQTRVCTDRECLEEVEKER